ncbi:MAG: hypothetical protein WBB98_15280 [Xanthobacteraceae bacterium]
MAISDIAPKLAPCQRCDKTFSQYRASQKNCPDCQYASRIETNKLRRRKLALAAGKAQRPTICLDCGDDLSLDNKDHRCPACWLDAKRKRNRDREARLRREKGVSIVGAAMSCTGCGCRIVRTTGPKRFCGECARQAKLRAHREANRKYEASRPPRKRDPDEARARSARYVARNPEKVREHSRRYNEANRESVNRKSRERNLTPARKDYMRAWDKRYRALPRNRLDQRMKAAVAAALKGKKSGRSWEALVGFTTAELMTHLERQFLPGMTWSNMGMWHIDHIVPKSSFSYEAPEDSDFKAAWKLTNLRPLWAAENLSKGPKRLLLI